MHRPRRARRLAPEGGTLLIASLTPRQLLSARQHPPREASHATPQPANQETGQSGGRPIRRQVNQQIRQSVAPTLVPPPLPLCH
ncbi:hypothetical protein EYF80_061620 [Liparis tanakae]|uniref:Uncharacterized protein n=1 Tax=Liparis tanakae TaxID=230148 RepID=A0A4Z2EIR1_9TELE|nr:hypothetical protein EYF80_061620 [Liparis tanakae]